MGMGASQRAAKGGRQRIPRFSDIKNSDVKLVGLGLREGAAEVSSRAAVGIISDSLYPFENENAPLGELTAAPHPREVLGVSLARALGLRDTERMSRNLRPDRRSRPDLAPAAGPLTSVPAAV